MSFLHDTKELLWPENVGAARAARDWPKGILPVILCCFPSNTQTRFLLPAPTPSAALFSLCYSVHKLEPWIFTLFQNYLGSQGTKLASPYLHIKDLAATASAGAGKGTNRTEVTVEKTTLFFFFCTEGAPHQDLYQTIYRTGSLQFWAFIIPAQHQPGFTSPLPPLASLPSIQTKCQLNADVRLRAAGTEVLFSYFCFSPKVCIIHSNLNIQIAQITETDVSSTRWKTSVRKEKPVPFKCLEMLKSLLLFLNSHVPFFFSSLHYKKYWFRY